MTIISGKCHKCGNTDVSMMKEYDGALGYEAIVCKVCGAYCDHEACHAPDEWSKEFVGIKGKTKVSKHKRIKTGKYNCSHCGRRGMYSPCDCRKR